MKLNLNYLLIGIIVIIILAIIVHKGFENFENQPTSNDIIAMLKQGMEKDDDDDNGDQSNPQCVKPANIERVARVIAKKYCPVPDDFNPNNYIKKAQVEDYCSSKDSVKCRDRMPDMSKYILKSAIPPEQECPACICPKINCNT